MILDGNARAGQAKVYATAREMELEKENKELAEFCIDLQLYVKSLFLSNDSVKSFQQIRKAACLCRYAYNDALMSSESRIKELEDKLKIAISALKRVDNILYEHNATEMSNLIYDALEKIGELK